MQDPASLLKSQPDFFTSFTLILCSNLDPSTELAVADLLWQRERTSGSRVLTPSDSSTPSNADIPLISIRNSGFIGRIGVQLREHCGTLWLYRTAADDPHSR